MDHFINDLNFQNIHVLELAKNCVLDSSNSSFYWKRNNCTIIKEIFEKELNDEIDFVIKKYSLSL